MVATGDCDAVQHLAVGPGNCDPDLTTKGRATASWDDSPWVTAVGGTTQNLSKTGKRLGSDPVWNLGQFGFPFGEGPASQPCSPARVPERRQIHHRV